MRKIAVWDILKSPVVTEKSVILKEDSTEEDSGRKQGIETDRLDSQGDTHQQGNGDQGPDLTLAGKKPGQRNPQKVTNPVNHGGPEDSPPNRALLEYLTGGNCQNQVDECGSPCQQADLEAAPAEAGGIYTEKTNRRATQDTEPGHVEIQMDKIRPKFARNGRVGKKSTQ